MSTPTTTAPGTRTSFALTEARTVHSRAENALFWLERREPDQETLDIMAALRVTVEALQPFHRTGRPTKPTTTKESQ